MEDKKILFDINGLVFYDDPEDSIPDAFGVKKDDFVKLLERMFKFVSYTMVVEGEKSIINALDKFLKSDHFKALEFQLKKPNDFFALGFALSVTTKRMHSLEKDFGGGDPINALISLLKNAEVEVIKHEFGGGKKNES